MSESVVPEFELRFPLSKVPFWAARYRYADDAAVEAIGVVARRRGWYTRDEFLVVTHWKTSRSKSRCERNEASALEGDHRARALDARRATPERGPDPAAGGRVPDGLGPPPSRPPRLLPDPRLPGPVEPRRGDPALPLLVRVLVGVHGGMPITRGRSRSVDAERSTGRSGSTRRSIKAGRGGARKPTDADDRAGTG